MIGISKELAAELTARGYSEADVLRLFGPHAHKGELRIVYQRPNGDRTAGLPSSRHMAYVARDWMAVAIVDEPPVLAPAARGTVPADMAADVAADRLALYRKGDQESVFSMRHHPDLLAKGWAFVRYPTAREEYLHARNGRRPSRAEAAIAATLAHVGEDAQPAEGGSTRKR